MYRIIDGGNIYQLDCTSRGSIRLSGRATNKPIQSGSEVADHYVNDPTTMSFEGVLSDAKTLYDSSAATSISVIDELKSLKESGRPFIFEGIADSTLIFDNCVFESLVIDNDATHGLVTFDTGSGIYSFRITCEIKQLKKAQRARLVSEPQVMDATSALTKGSGVNSSPNFDEENKNKENISLLETANRARRAVITGSNQ